MVCLHGGRCSHVGNQSKCICSEGYHGKHCELKTDRCQSSPCLNGATCVDNGDLVFCKCPVGFVGRHCEKGGSNFSWCFPLISRVTNHNAKARGTDWMRLPVLKLSLCHWSRSFKICAPCHYCRHVFISESVWYDRRGVRKILWDVWNAVSNPPLCHRWAEHSHPTRDFNHTLFNPIGVPKFNIPPPGPPYRAFQNNLTPAIPSPKSSRLLSYNKITPTLTIHNRTAHGKNQIKL